MRKKRDVFNVFNLFRDSRSIQSCAYEHGISVWLGTGDVKKVKKAKYVPVSTPPHDILLLACTTAMPIHLVAKCL